MAVLFGWIIIVPPFIALYNTAKHIHDAEQRLSVQPQLEPALVIVMMLIISIANGVYIQEHQNRILGPGRRRQPRAAADAVVSRTVDAVRWGSSGRRASRRARSFPPSPGRATARPSWSAPAKASEPSGGPRTRRERGVEGYRAVVDDPEVEAVYVALPNGLHAEWTIAALEAGKAVLCEKPLCGTTEETERVLAAARMAAGPLWEAFVFPFSEQLARVRALLDDGAVGQVVEISSRFTFTLDDPGDIRLDRIARRRLDPGHRLLPDPARPAPLRRRARPHPDDRGRDLDERRCRSRALGGAQLPRRSSARPVVRLRRRLRHAHAGAGERRRAPRFERIPRAPRRQRDGPARWTGDDAGRDDGRRTLVHAGAATHPPSAPRPRAAAAPRGRRGDGQRHGDRVAAGRGPCRRRPRPGRVPGMRRSRASSPSSEPSTLAYAGGTAGAAAADP